MLASDSLDATGETLQENAVKATEAIVLAHQKMEEWHGVVKTNIKDLDVAEGQMSELPMAALGELKDKNRERLKAFDSLVGIGAAP